MSPFIEFEGRNVEQAITRACEVLNIPRDQLRHDVISFGATGIFGLVGIKKARIRVSAPSQMQATATDAPPPGQSGSPQTVPEPQAAAGDIPVSVHPIREHGLSIRDRTADQLLSPGVPRDGGRHLQPLTCENSANLGKLALQRMVDSVTCGAEITVTPGARQIVYTINGGNPDALFGKKGQTLEAIEYLLKKIVHKFAEDRTRIIVNIAGQTMKRQENLQLLASRFAEKACRNGKCVIIGRFSPQDRKIIHMALKNDLRVKTQSQGEGYLKKLVVMPRGE